MYTKDSRVTLIELRTYEPHLTLTHVGDYEACVLVFAADQTQVQSLLPSGLVLRPQSITPAGQHPVQVFLGEQRQVRGIMVPSSLCPLLTPIGLCMHFLEAAITIPFVGKMDVVAGPPDHFCSIRIYLNRLLPIYLGWLCGFPKVEGQLNQTSSSFQVRTTTGSPLLNASIVATGPYGDVTVYPNFTPLRPMFEQPHIGRLFSLGTPLLSGFLCADMDLKLGAAEIQPVQVQGNLSSSFSSVLPTSFSFPGIDTAPLGAFRLRTTWELPPPNPC